MGPFYFFKLIVAYRNQWVYAISDSNKGGYSMSKSEMTKRIRGYIQSHPAMQKDIVLYTDIIKAEEELGIHRFYIMMVQGYGRVL